MCASCQSYPSQSHLRLTLYYTKMRIAGAQVVNVVLPCKLSFKKASREEETDKMNRQRHACITVEGERESK